MRKLLLTVMALVTVLGLSSCGLLPGNDHRQADARMQQITDAVDNQDKAALKALFSNRAVEQATDLDQRLDYFLSFFPSGGLTCERDALGSEVDVDRNGRKTELLDVLYKVSADGHDYWLVFKDFTVNETIDPENVGFYGLGVAPWTEKRQSGATKPLLAWARSIQMEGDGEKGYPGVFVPE